MQFHPPPPPHTNTPPHPLKQSGCYSETVRKWLCKGRSVVRLCMHMTCVLTIETCLDYRNVLTVIMTFASNHACSNQNLTQAHLVIDPLNILEPNVIFAPISPEEVLVTYMYLKAIFTNGASRNIRTKFLARWICCIAFPSWFDSLTLFVLNFSEKKYTYIYMLCHYSTVIWHRYLKPFLE